MRVMVLVKASKASEAGGMPDPELITAMGAFNEQLVNAGLMKAGEGLHPSSAGKRVVFEGGGQRVVDGPFTPTEDLVAGFWIWQVRSMDEAVAWAKRCPPPMPGETSVLELRPIFETEDFGEAMTPEQRAHEDRLRAATERGPRAKILPHLWYTKDAEVAAKLYVSIFPDSSFDRVSVLESPSPSGPPGSVKIVDFRLFGQPFQAMTAGPHHEFNDAFSIVVRCDDQAELDRYWSALLADGGHEQACGWLTDRFGVRWQIVPAVLDAWMDDPDRARSRRVTDALLQMVKLDIAALERARAGA